MSENLDTSLISWQQLADIEDLLELANIDDLLITQKQLDEIATDISTGASE